MDQRQKNEFETPKSASLQLVTRNWAIPVSAFIQRDAAGMVLRRIEHFIPETEALNLPPVLKT